MKIKKITGVIRGKGWMVVCLSVFFSGCTSMDMIAESNEASSVKMSSEHWSGHGSFNDFGDSGVTMTKVPSGKDKKKSDQNEKIDKPRGRQLIGQGANYSVTYRTTYWDSLLSVLSLGFYVPFDVECRVNESGTSSKTK